jgi:hypothetical protein
VSGTRVVHPDYFEVVFESLQPAKLKDQPIGRLLRGLEVTGSHQGYLPAIHVRHVRKAIDVESLC